MHRQASQPTPRPSLRQVPIPTLFWPHGNGGYDLYGTHTFAAPQTAPIQITIEDSYAGSSGIQGAGLSGNDNTSTAAGTFTTPVEIATETNQNFYVFNGQPFSDVLLATITNPDPNVNDYFTNINFGNGFQGQPPQAWSNAYTTFVDTDNNTVLDIYVSGDMPPQHRDPSPQPFLLEFRMDL